MNTCSVCGQEVRHGTRGLITGWLHREDVDHAPIFGQRWTPEEQARIDAELDRPRTRVSGEAAKHCPTYQAFWPLETYTARRHSLKDDAAKAYDAANNPEDEIIPEPEMPAHPIEIADLPARSGMRQIANLIERTDGWELTSLTRSKGPYIGSSGKVLSISESTLIRARGPEVDSGLRLAVAFWRDGAFDFAYTGILKDGIVTSTAANSEALKAWIKDIP